MKRLLKPIWLVAVLLLLGTGIRLFHLGPFGIRPGDERVLTRLTLTNGATFAVVARRNDNIIEAYTVNLYRIDADGTTTWYLLGFKDSYWWKCSLRLSADRQVIQVRADGQAVARYSFDRGFVTWIDGLPAQSGWQDNSGHVQKLLAALK